MKWRIREEKKRNVNKINNKITTARSALLLLLGGGESCWLVLAWRMQHECAFIHLIIKKKNSFFSR